MSNLEKDKAAGDGKVADGDDEPDEWLVLQLLEIGWPDLADCKQRDKRIFSTGCAGEL
jgi:hypothetical protein